MADGAGSSNPRWAGGTTCLPRVASPGTAEMPVRAVLWPRFHRLSCFFVERPRAVKDPARTGSVLVLGRAGAPATQMLLVIRVLPSFRGREDSPRRELPLASREPCLGPCDSNR